MTGDQPAWRLCSFGEGDDGARSWTDIYTNQTLLASVIPEIPLTYMTKGRMPAFALPSFLHEATHHTCLNSPVGLAVAVLEYQARDLVNGGDDDDLPEARLYNLRTATFLHLYRPLLEGLAMFAELDAVPGGSPVVSAQMTLASDLFFREAAAARPEGTFFSEIAEALLGERQNSPFADRKAALLSEPLLARDGYLIGYLLVKAFATWSALVAGSFDDSDFVLGFLVGHFFYDYELVDLLLRPAPHEESEGAALVNHLRGRLASLFRDDDLAERGRAYEQLSLAFEVRAADLDVMELPAVAGDEAAAERVRSVLVEKISAFRDEPIGEILRRSLLHVASLPVSLNYPRPDVVLAMRDGTPLVAARPWEPVDTTVDQAGSVDVFYEASTRTQGVAVSSGGVLIAAVLPDDSEELLPWLRQFVVAREIVMSASESAVERLETLIGEGGWSELRDTAVKGTTAWRDETYVFYALPWIPPEHQDDFVKAAGRRGLSGIVGPDAMRPLAVLGLLDGLGAYLEEAELTETPAKSLADECESLVETFKDRFGGTPLLREPVEEEGKWLTRVRSFL